MVRALSTVAPEIDTDTVSGHGIVPYERWLTQADDLRRRFTQGLPTPHLVLDDFLQSDAARRALASFPPPGDGWIHYLHYNERNFGMNDRTRLPEAAREVIDELNSPAFLSLLREITGMSLCADTSLEGGGLHQSERDGYLHLHADFTVHPHRPTWRRSLNLLIYLNPDWNEAWGGHLELWDPEVRECVQRIAPAYNRAVLFYTHEKSFHGFPDPLGCPADVTRKAFALYYFTEEDARLRAVATRYRGRPGDRVTHKALILLDTLLLRGYDRAKRIFGFDDSFANGILRMLSRRG